MVGAPTTIGKRLENALEYSGRMESTVLLEDPETLDAELLQEEVAEAKRSRNGGGQAWPYSRTRLDHGAAGYSAVWQNGQSWVDVKSTWDTPRKPTRRQTAPERATIFTGARAPPKHAASEVPGPSQICALQITNHIAALQRARPDIAIRNPLVPRAQGRLRKREGRRVGQARGGGARHPRGGMAS